MPFTAAPVRFRKNDFTEERESDIRKTLEKAVTAGYEILQSGGNSLDAVTRAVTLLEDSPHFNAAKGAVFNAEGKNELDASIMNGADLSAGAVAAVHNIRNPILLARQVMMDSPHVMLMGEGAEVFARNHGIRFEDDDYFFTEYRWQQLKKIQASDNPDALLLSEAEDRWFSTVGAVALDRKRGPGRRYFNRRHDQQALGVELVTHRSSAPAPMPITVPAQSAQPVTVNFSFAPPQPATFARGFSTRASAWKILRMQ